MGASRCVFSAVVAAVIVACGGKIATQTCGDCADSSISPPGPDGASPMCPTTVACSSYCEFVSSTCTGANAGLDKATCNALCERLTQATAHVGSPSDTARNTIGCRIYHACAARSSPGNVTIHCPHASIWSGGDTCGTQCDAFCEIEMAVCPTGNANAQFAGVNHCLSACGMWALGNPTDTSGNTLGCREYHLGVAASSIANVAMHCPHTGIGSSIGDAGPNTTCGP